MNCLLPLLFTALVADAPKVETRFEQVAPVPPNARPARSPDQGRAVVLVHGYIFHLSSTTVGVPAFRDWQRPGSTLVKALGKDADVYSFAYGQNAALDEVVKQGALKEAVASLRKLGYREIVLLGHSAGGLIARQFVEDNPDCGVTRVVQLCAPNCGTPTARTKVHAVQQAFVDSLTPENREKTLTARAGTRIPASVEFVCVLGYCDAKHEGDGVVPCAAQWSADLRKQGIPVVLLEAAHNVAPRSARAAEVLAKVVREKSERWTEARVEQVRKDFFKD